MQARGWVEQSDRSHALPDGSTALVILLLVVTEMVVVSGAARLPVAVGCLLLMLVLMYRGATLRQ